MKKTILRQKYTEPGLVAFTISGQETERVYSYNIGAHAGSGGVRIDPLHFPCTRKISRYTWAYQSLYNESAWQKAMLN